MLTKRSMRSRLSRGRLLPQNSNAKDVGVLPFPFDFMKLAMKTGHITSVISASANNEVAYKKSHPGFMEYNHPIAMDAEELALCFPNLFSGMNDEARTELLDQTGGVPLQVQLVSTHKGNYESEEIESIQHFLRKLRDETHEATYAEMVKSAISCVLLGSVDGTDIYDKKYTLRVGTTRRYEPVYPLVMVAYRDFFWNEIMAYLEEHEATLLDTCKYAETGNDTRGRLFELIVIRRCIDGAVTETEKSTLTGFSGLSRCKLVDRFTTQKLPERLPEDGMYVPMNSNFPAIDLIWKMPGNKIWCVQVHVSHHPSALVTLEKMCQEAGWKSDVVLLYLSPEPQISNLASVKKLLPPQPADRDRRLDAVQKAGDKMVTVVQLESAPSFTCLADLQWPHRCSLEEESTTMNTGD
jgi:hypothetical protein